MIIKKENLNKYLPNALKMKATQIEASERPQDTQILKEEELQECLSERKSRQIKFCA